MATFAGVIVETRGHAAFEAVARKHGVSVLAPAARAHALIECDVGRDGTMRLAEVLSRDLDGAALAIEAQTGADAYTIAAFERGACVRKLVYTRDYGGWIERTGAAQTWEPAFYFDGPADAGSGAWPDTLDDELSDEDVARYEAARRAGDAGPVFDLVRPSGWSSIERILDALGVSADAPTARLQRPSFWSRLTGRG